MEWIEKAPAKINLGLDVVAKRKDGFHELEMIMTSIDLSDTLTFTTNDTDQITITSNVPFLPTGKKNLVFQAAELLKKQFNIKQGVHINIDKVIPVAAGLAGGSSDCAATLRGLNNLWQLKLDFKSLAKLGEQLGSDVPYCVYSQTAYVTGRGENIQLLPKFQGFWVVLVKPQMSVSTPSIFNQVNLATIQHPDISAIKLAIETNNYQEVPNLIGNSLEAITISQYPIIEKIKSKLSCYGADGVLMSGSGPTVFALCRQESRARRVFNSINGFCEEVYLVRTL
ncbi:MULTISPECIES: 4-(cytidine 5'-diphospho)-2-C-methyl-D-erythritol kinase [unclassified Enterococcus]|uniref:4-(cytidine 5'-diphospho)-2-C-methyl-D-erythritol kinase n=1 Tax=unclassified Enterococcus TaxID=2608891 RepID=UPI0015557B0A|nr:MULTISPECIES: 4-(cytidine 5'-diphospho)-2-C-methyl-D-erythritol kinase [unclassified Enterococcus]MBS7577311.1 4-(cytidine 5'-diphospho)-2-C-methyl-D-erythritol kinase [Enterococcus sp. MMGLQ5-2]MBS7584596.1 4-(cytidine 5'-diphospho)-2-C-methyl-D-erythritol kinase [Enterococcus sp. MMGLQ5-1]NPD12451.1 4-(cytidine 5'-diphospho)-2-C-methyl-D-erythritol kinase [Enterococcus sp. MMGLQ5-1]NPD37145.1 4-(cytidine 5'-diphospho)-2-C-methyl-D-erythritol kinase [Enterococcus sp. MMGLQ5-2]